ncbi:MAG TPA: DUF1848 domain-containing protein [Chitinispirillaceae bacterium]|nr:DUF1848 domain-containing protein [Chitinispirillaceae bacterium]
MAYRGWEKVKIKNDSGESVSGIAPVIISASRATDIPAFYGEWLIDRLDKGYVKWINPFNGQPQYISFQKTRLIVFWTKNPSLFIPLLSRIEQKNIHYLFQFTLNDYENLELHLPSLTERIETFRKLSGQIGKERISWRFDPIILTDKITPEILLGRIEKIGNQISGFTKRLTISFLSRYAKVDRNLNRAGLSVKNLDHFDIKKIGEGLRDLGIRWGIEVVSCAEQIDLSAFNILNGSCIDPFNIARNFGDDPELRNFLGLKNETDIFGKNSISLRTGLKDPGQRKLCGCTISKDIGRYDTCPHGCIYCYANSSMEKASINYRTKKGDVI